MALKHSCLKPLLVIYSARAKMPARHFFYSSLSVLMYSEDEKNTPSCVEFLK